MNPIDKNTNQPWWYVRDIPENMLISGAELSPWDIVYINGVELPGISNVEVTGGPKLDIKPSAGKHYSTITSQGYKPCDILITTIFWTPSQWMDWQGIILPMLEPPPKKNSKSTNLNSYLISHPVTHARNIEAITIATISGPNKANITGAKEMKIKAYQWSNDFQDVKATNTPKGAGKPADRGNAMTGRNNPSGVSTPAKAVPK